MFPARGLLRLATPATGGRQCPLGLDHQNALVFTLPVQIATAFQPESAGQFNLDKPE
jgi:hypothetical protein